jgi:hypothetical protein
MGLFTRTKEPVFLKEDSNAQIQLEKLRALEPFLTLEGKKMLFQDIKYLEYGIIGEKNIIFELKNSHMPLVVLHDIYLEYQDLNAQIDFIVFTKKLCFIIECKNLYGDIEINHLGDFVRSTRFGNKRIKEGIYSPITQNQRHLELMKKIHVEKQTNLIKKFAVDKYFEDFNKSIVVLANPKTVLHTRYAKKETKQQVIRLDQLIKYIKEMDAASTQFADTDDKMLARAQVYLNNHIHKEKDYTKKYDAYRVSTISVSSDLVQPTFVAVENRIIKKNEGNIESSAVYKQLKEYRLLKSREENIKAYVIYTNQQLNDLIIKNPTSKTELLLIQGFAKARVDKYGEDILKILKEY